MTPRQACTIAAAFIKVRVLKRRIPLLVSWNLTFRCGRKCLYCGTDNMQVAELDTGQILARLGELWDLGARWITFGGGEPLLRDDVGQILSAAKRKGFQVFLSTNGLLVAAKAGELGGVDHANLSLDGGREVHDIVRGQGTFDKVMEAIGVFRDLRIPLSLSCVLSKYNLDQVQTVLDIAAGRGLLVTFQPADVHLNTSWEPNPIAPPVEAYRRVIGTLIDMKKAGAPIRNSVTALRHMARWPDPARIWCPGEGLIAVVQPDGTLVACHHLAKGGGTGNTPSPVESLTEQFRNLPAQTGCVQCWCAPLVELSLIFSLRPEAVLNAVRRMR